MGSNRTHTEGIRGLFMFKPILADDSYCSLIELRQTLAVTAVSHLPHNARHVLSEEGGDNLWMLL